LTFKYDEEVVTQYRTPPVISIHEALTLTPGRRVSIEGMVIDVSINYFLLI